MDRYTSEPEEVVQVATVPAGVEVVEAAPEEVEAVVVAQVVAEEVEAAVVAEVVLEGTPAALAEQPGL